MKTLFLTLFLLIAVCTSSCLFLHNYSDFSHFEGIENNERIHIPIQNSIISFNPFSVHITRGVRKRLSLGVWMYSQTLDQAAINELQRLNAVFGDDTLVLKQMNIAEPDTIFDKGQHRLLCEEEYGINMWFVTQKDYSYNSFKQAYLNDTLTLTFGCDSLHNKVAHKMVGRNFRYRKLLFERW